MEHFATAPCEDLVFDATVINKNDKLIIVDCICWNKAHTTQIASGRVCFNIYQNPQPFLYKMFGLLLRVFGDVDLKRLNPFSYKNR